MSWVARLLAAMLALTNPDSRQPARVEMIVNVTVDVTASWRGWEGWTHRQRASLLLAKIAAESGGFRLAVHNGSKRSDNGQSICLGQIHWGPWLHMSRAEWRALGGVDEASTRRCLTEVWRQLTLHKHLCGGVPNVASVARVYSSYGTGKGCAVRPWALPRAKQFERLASK
jgi:hypothetical protein